ncbi:MAG: hypothetical protein COU90_01325 [Candidatus Ryanbacteria bacterium CG10_big_fil_rev_8_21_14_0_10_43_42]|uniref:Uncharacterized protein n=1 Tax=Candidatus Ryanbacteria bacterium CG10_big_fil_rev_8_21_14_0_10_43_42 TaxID=1974864 RepID=A0A2M8KXM9_9BACT|nr:MAG: hypothetical protein COU90_01325 [Candidatus Ryanbacteria bacterium CG10_big_fil_rev_8_21_14_0_10_43_42]
MTKYERDDFGIQFNTNTPSFELRREKRMSLTRFLIEHSGGHIQTKRSASLVLILITIIAGSITFLLLHDIMRPPTPMITIPPPSQRT